jgi:hypothetical protein
MSIRRAVVIGAGSGVGHATGSALTAAGARVLAPGASGTPPRSDRTQPAVQNPADCGEVVTTASDKGTSEVRRPTGLPRLRAGAAQRGAATPSRIERTGVAARRSRSSSADPVVGNLPRLDARKRPSCMFTYSVGTPCATIPAVNSSSSATTRRRVRPVTSVRLPATASRSRAPGADSGGVAPSNRPSSARMIAAASARSAGMAHDTGPSAGATSSPVSSARPSRNGTVVA